MRVQGKVQAVSSIGASSPPVVKRVFVIGLDAAVPELVFGQWRPQLPNFLGLAQSGYWGRLASCVPAITVPAWSSMLSSRDPGALGFYGFRNRADYSYDHMFAADGDTVRVKRVWDYLGEAGKRSILVGVPQTYPVRPVEGLVVSGFLTPGREVRFTHPESLREEVLRIAPEYGFDARPFRTERKKWLLGTIRAMTEDRFSVVDHFLETEPWDFFMAMEIGLDRLQHGFWHYHDPDHIHHEPGTPYEHVLRDYYRRLDAKIGEWIERLGAETAILVVSDHGAQRVDGWICINEWLHREGYLRFLEEPKTGRPLPFEKVEVDWGHTQAWGAGGYYGRIFLNVQGREPQGVVPEREVEALRDELTERLKSLPAADGTPLKTRVFKPEEIYPEVNGIPPDLIVYFDNLRWRSAGSLGHGEVYRFANDTGPDECNHAEDGIFILSAPGLSDPGAELQGAQLMDVAPTVLKLLGHPVPEEMQGRPLWERPLAGPSDHG